MMSKTENGDNSVIDFWNFQKVDQVIYTLVTICDPNTKILAQAVLDIFCSQTSMGLQFKEKNI